MSINCCTNPPKERIAKTLRRLPPKRVLERERKHRHTSVAVRELQEARPELAHDALEVRLLYAC